MLEMNWAMNRPRYTRLRNGAHVDGFPPSARSWSGITGAPMVDNPSARPTPFTLFQGLEVYDTDSQGSHHGSTCPHFL